MNFESDIKHIVSSAREYTYRAANLMQVASNWLLGWRIVEQEQHGERRAEYGKRVIEQASKVLTEEFGKGFSETTLRAYRQFYLSFPNLQIQQALPAEFKMTIEQIQRAAAAESGNVDKGLTVKAQSLPEQLSWMHYERLMRVKDAQAREWYMREASLEQWDYRTLKRNIDSQYYYRLLQTPAAKKHEVTEEMHRLTADYQHEKSVFIKNPLIVEFLGLSQNVAFTETALEEAILTHITRFLMEMGKGYALVARQQHIHTEDDDYYIDLVFYNYLLKCFVLIDLKTTKVSYQDAGQMDMYLKLYDTCKKTETDNPTIGIILCAETNADVARFSSLATNKQMYASKYLTYMPSPEELRREIEQQKEIYKLQYPEDKQL
ncbi:MAG: PDDEXK nuclease domain-containing protein [Bacteroidales bacterium]|nr:PDDEXK nuclease domain-containing protein [Bacteroidales bacterium]